MACGGMIFKTNFKFSNNNLNFILGYYCSMDLQRQSGHSGLCQDTSSLVVPTFDTKVTEYLSSGGFFFL